MANPSARRAWLNAEEKCFAYLCEKLNAVPNVSGYRGEIPGKVQEVTNSQMWLFAISGGGEQVRIANGAGPWNAWRMNAEFYGIFGDLADGRLGRDTAMEIAGLLWDCLPAGVNTEASLEGVTQLSYTSAPSLTRVVMPLRPDRDKGGNVRVWRLEVPMEAVFFNVESE